MDHGAVSLRSFETALRFSLSLSFGGEAYSTSRYLLYCTVLKAEATLELVGKKVDFGCFRTTEMRVLDLG